MSGQPNFLFILTDQHRASSTGCYGKTDARTPCIDALAAEGALFENAYCQYPICVSSRQSLLTGRYPGNNGTYQNYLQSIDPWQWTLPGALALTGYETALIGKAHCNQNGFLFRMESEEYAHRYWPKDALARIQPPLFGMDYRRNAETAGPWPHDEHYLQCSFVEKEGLRFLSRNHTAPFFALLSYDYPHPPFLVPERFWNAFDPDALELPPTDPNNPCSPFWGEELVNEAMIRNYLRGYYACLTCVDESIGRVLDAAEAGGLLDNTIVIYTSDHGEAGGRHGKYEKHSFFEQEIHVPLVIRLPGGRHHRVTEIVELIDLAPTILDLAGVRPDDDARLDGAPLTGLLRGESTDWKNRAFCENYWPARTERDGRELPEDYGRALIRDGFKCCIGGNMPEPRCLFDLRNDPEEMDNLWNAPDHRTRRDAMTAEIMATWHRIEHPAQSYFESP